VSDLAHKFELITNRILKCHSCDLCLGKVNYVPGILGTSNPSIVVVGEAPGRHENLLGVPFVGKSGKVLNLAMKTIFNLERGEYSITNTLKCWPPGNRKPTQGEMKACRPFLKKQLKILSPCYVIATGLSASQSILQDHYLSMKELRSHYYLDADRGILVYPTYHPAATMYRRNLYEEFLKDLKSLSDSSYKEKRTYKRFNLD